MEIIKNEKRDKKIERELEEMFLKSWVFKNDSERKEWLKGGKNGAPSFQKETPINWTNILTPPWM